MKLPHNTGKNTFTGFTLIELRKGFSIFESRFSIGRYCAKAMRHQWFDYSFRAKRHACQIENPKSKVHHAPRGFTLIELLTVIAIIGVLAAIIIPTVSKVRESAKTAQDRSNIRQIALAILLYRDANRNTFPDRGVAYEMDGWIEELRKFDSNLNARGIFSSALDNVMRTDPTKEKRSYALNRYAAHDINIAKKHFFNPPNPSSMILLADRAGATSIIPNDGTPSRGSMDVAASPDALPRFYKGGKANLFAFFDGHVEMTTYDSVKHGWSTAWTRAHWIQYYTTDR